MRCFPLLTPMQDLKAMENFLGHSGVQGGQSVLLSMKALMDGFIVMVRESPSYASGLNHLEPSSPAHECHRFLLFPEAEGSTFR